MTNNSTKSLSFEVDLTRELKQEKILFKELYGYLNSHEKFSNEIFDSMSHELRTPVVSIKANIDMLLQNQFGKLTTVQKERLQRIKENTESLITVIFQMLEKSKKRNGL